MPGYEDTPNTRKFFTLRVSFWNDIYSNYSSKTYDYACDEKARQYVYPGDTIQMLTQYGDNSVLVRQVMSNLTPQSTREIDYKMTKGKYIDKFNATKITKIKGSKMKPGMKDMMKRFMCEVENVGMNLTDGKVGIKKDGSVFTLSEKYNVEENMFDFMSFEMPAMGISTPITNVKVGDIVVENGKAIGWVTKEPSEDRIEITRVTGTKYSMTPPENKTMGTKNIMIVKSMFEGAGGTNMMQNMMMMSMMSGEEMDEKKMMMLMLMMMQGQGTDQPNPMMNMLPMMMFMNK